VCELDTDFDGCMEIVQKLAKEPGIYLAKLAQLAALEGQKTVGIEIVAAVRLAGARLDRHPGGNLGNVSALGAGFDLMLELGLITKRPRIVLAQAQSGQSAVPGLQGGLRQVQADRRAEETEASAIRIGNPVSVHRAISAEGLRWHRSSRPASRSSPKAAASADRSGALHLPAQGVRARGPGEVREARATSRPGQRAVVISTASGLKFTDFKVRYHEGRHRQCRLQEPQHAGPAPNDFEAVKKVVLGDLDR
jgi:threonine synthase